MKLAFKISSILLSERAGNIVADVQCVPVTTDPDTAALFKGDPSASFSLRGLKDAGDLKPSDLVDVNLTPRGKFAVYEPEKFDLVEKAKPAEPPAEPAVEG